MCSARPLQTALPLPSRPRKSGLTQYDLPDLRIIDAKPGQARVSWRGGSAAGAERRRTGWGDYTCCVLVAPPTPDPSPSLASLVGGVEMPGVWKARIHAAVANPPIP